MKLRVQILFELHHLVVGVEEKLAPFSTKATAKTQVTASVDFCREIGWPRETIMK